LEDKLRRFASLGVEEACVIRIDKDFFALSPESFIEKVLKPLDPALLVVGEDYSFGAGGRGRVADLRKAFPVEVVPLLKDGKAKISTQLIIRDLRSGRLEKANRALGYPYEIHGIVGHGLQNGRKLGFPTANLVLRDPYVLPKDGVYFGLSYVRGFPYRSLINVGRNPTIGGLTHSLVESYMEGFEGEIYGETLYVAFLRYLRPEVRFPSFDELKAQIEKDKKALRESAKGDC
jgi:riboflavin kinase/FMN adenylyltransferase